MSRKWLLLMLVTWSVAVCAAQPKPHATLLLKNARIITMDAVQPYATAMAVVGDRIVAVGGDAEIEAWAGPQTAVIDADRQLVTPGFIEGHGHFMALGEALGHLDLSSAHTWDDIVARVAVASARAKPGEWVIGFGWHQEKWNKPEADSVGGVPRNSKLSVAVPRNPVMLGHASGHGALVNDAALALAGIDSGSANPPGGEIVRDGTGVATGWLVDSAAEVVRAVYDHAQRQRAPAVVRADLEAQVKRAAAEALAHGITTFHDAGAPLVTIDLYRDLAAAGKLPLRMYAMIGQESNTTLAAQLARYRMIGGYDNFLTVRSIKRMVDGALGSRSAWLLDAYTDAPGNTGLVVDPVTMIEETAEIAIANGYQLNTHAIGDRANREILDLYQRVQTQHPAEHDLRWRIEHAQHLHPDDVPRFARLGIIASMQGVHAISDGPWVPKRLGNPRSGERTYVWRALWDSGAIVTNGTDVPVEKINPIDSFHASVTRSLADGSAFFPEQCLTREEALRSYTVNNAYAAFEENLKGSIRAGKLADIVVWSRDITKVPAEEIPGTEALYTILGGKVVYQRPAEQ